MGLMDLEDKTVNALKWVVSILNKHGVDYQIAGGFAAKLYGSSRPLNDIDIDISERHFATILPEALPYVIEGPGRFKDDKWDCERMTLDYKGQIIDITGSDTLKMTNKDRTEWLQCHTGPFHNNVINVAGININVIYPRDLAEYKKDL